MPAKFHIHTAAARPRVRPVGKLGIIDWREDCSSCHNCVKRGCVYGLYRDESERLRNENGYLDYLYQCKGCLNCIQNCTKNILTRVLNPEYQRLGDDYFTPEIVLSTWYQADTGAIPVSGSGYGGPFSGDGFDSMWTDMSEIVRPTRDGIHGREYINTSVDIGRRLDHLAFSGGTLSVTPAPLIETPMPVMFDVLPERFQRGSVLRAVIQAANEIGLYAVVRARDLQPEFATAQVVPWLEEQSASVAPTAAADLVMVSDCSDVLDLQAALKQGRPGRIVAIRVPTTPGVAQRVVHLARCGAEVVDLVFDAHGREEVETAPRHMRDVIREVHEALTKDGTRDQLTLISSGGIAMAEHVAKAVICGVDMVAVDLALLIALECRLCGECGRAGQCPVALHEAELAYATRRVVNLMGAWHSQLIEMLGAMGIREARRLRGETGRCMFFEDLEKNTFGRLFGARKAELGASS